MWLKIENIYFYLRVFIWHPKCFFQVHLNRTSGGLQVNKNSNLLLISNNNRFNAAKSYSLIKESKPNKKQKFFSGYFSKNV